MLMSAYCIFAFCLCSTAYAYKITLGENDNALSAIRNSFKPTIIERDSNIFPIGYIREYDNSDSQVVVCFNHFSIIFTFIGVIKKNNFKSNYI